MGWVFRFYLRGIREIPMITLKSIQIKVIDTLVWALGVRSGKWPKCRDDFAKGKPCAACGSDMRYQPGTAELVCDHCAATQAILAPDPRDMAHALQEIDLNLGLADDLPAAATEEVRSTTCPSCGAVVEFSGANHANLCPYCATAVVVDTGSHRHIQPHTVLPFMLTETDARAALTKWLGVTQSQQ